MERRRRLVRLASAAAVALVLAGGASACSSGPLAKGPAATVNGVEITRAEVQAEIETNRDFYRSAAEAGLTDTDYATLADDIDGVGADTYSMDATTQALLTLMQDELVRQELEAADALPTKDDEDALRAQITGQLPPEQLEQLDADYIDKFVASNALIQALRTLRAEEADAGLEDPDPAEVEAQRDARYEEIVAEQPYCVAVIRSGSEADADAALARVEGGEDFGAVATEVSTLTESREGGFLGCGSAEQLAQAFPGIELDGAAQGDVLGPFTVTDQTGQSQFDVVQIAGVEGPTREQAAAQLEAEVPATAVPTDPASFDSSQLVGELLADAEITVDPRFGTWNPDTLLLEPVVGATTTTIAVPDGAEVVDPSATAGP